MLPASPPMPKRPLASAIPPAQDAGNVRHMDRGVVKTRERRGLAALAAAAVLLLLLFSPSRAATLHRGVNITGWFRFPSGGAASAYISNAALADLHAAGFDFVRLAVDPDVLSDPAPLVDAIRRLQRHGLSVVVSPHPTRWHLEQAPDRLRRFWQALAPRLIGLDPERTAPEIVNEPVFPHDAARWAALQRDVLGDIRAVLPRNTVVLTGADWGSIGGLLALAPEADPNVVYSFHFYDPAELTSLAAWQKRADHAALARLPFPVADRDGCRLLADGTEDAASRGLMRYYCATGWDGARIAAQIGRAADWARMHHVRLLAGEFGATAALPPATRLAWMTAVRTAFEAQGIAWALWGYDDIMGFAVPRPLPLRPRLDPALLAALGLPTRM